MSTIQNRCGHGIDWVDSALTGKHAGNFIAFEVKGGLNGRAKSWSQDQRSLQTFADSRLTNAKSNDGVWAHRNVVGGKATAEFAKYVNDEMYGKAWSGYLIQHHKMRTKPDVRWTPWK